MTSFSLLLWSINSSKNLGEWIVSLLCSLWFLLVCFIFWPTAKHWAPLPPMLCKKKNCFALALFSYSGITLLKTFSCSDERKCYLPLEEPLCLKQGKLPFRAAIWKGSHSGNLHKFSFYCPHKEHLFLDIQRSPCLAPLMCIWGEMAFLGIRGRASHLCYQSWSLPPSGPISAFICFWEG